MQIEMSNSGVFSRLVALQPIASIPGGHSLQFSSRLDSARDPQAIQRNFEAILDRADLVALRQLIDAALQN